MDRMRQIGWDIAIVITAIILVVVLWHLGFKEISILTLILGFAIWITEKRIDQQNKIILQASQAGYDFKGQATQEMFEATKELWKQAVWLAMNFSVLWPGADDDEERRKGYLDRLSEFEIYVATQSILLPKKILEGAKQFYSAIQEYRIGRDIREMATSDRDPESSREGGRMMTSGAKNLQEAYDNLFSVIRGEFKLEDLPQAIVEIKTESDTNSRQ